MESCPRCGCATGAAGFIALWGDRVWLTESHGQFVDTKTIFGALFAKKRVQVGTWDLV